MTARRSIALVAVAVLLLLAAFGGWRYARYRARKAADAQRAAIERCLLGAPLDAGVGPSARVHRIALGNPPADWPKRCDRHVSALADALDSSGHPGDASELRAKWGKGFDLAQLEQSPWDLDGLIGSGSSAEPPADVVAAPPPVSVADERTPVLLKATLAGASADALAASHLSLVLAPGRLCNFARTFDSAECSAIGKRAPAGALSFQLWPPTDDGAPPWLTDHLQHDESAIRFFRPDTGMLVDTGSPTRAVVAYAFKDGSVVTLGPSEGEQRGWDLLHWHGKEHGPAYTLDIDAKRFLLLGERLVWVARADDDYDHLYSAPLSVEPLRLGKREDHGRMMALQLEACRTKDALVLASTRGGETKVIFFSDKGASSILTAKLPADARVPGRVLACGNDDFSITRVATRARKRSDSDVLGFVVQYARCTADACQVQEVDLDKVFESAPDGSRPRGEKDTEVVAGGLGGRLLLVWRSATRGVRLRVGSPADLGQAPDQLAYDDGVQDGRAAHESTVSRMALYPRHDAAVLLLEKIAEGGIVALAVHPDGKATPISAKP